MFYILEIRRNKKLVDIKLDKLKYTKKVDNID